MERVVSVIIPAYNAEIFLEKCVLSITAQNIPEDQMEIIIVDNLSTDSTPLIINALTQRFSNIIATNCDIAGVGEARNRGLDLARGRYIMFADSDDTFKENVFKTLLDQAISKDLDMLSYDYCEQLDSPERHHLNYYKKIRHTYTDSVHTGQQFLSDNKYTVTVWSYLFKRDFLNQNNIRFTNFYHEDDEFTTHSLLLAKRIMHSNLKAYNYLIRQGTKMDLHNCDTVLNRLEMLSHIKSLLKSIEMTPQAAKKISKNIGLEAYRAVCSSIRHRHNMEDRIFEHCRQLQLLPIQSIGRPIKQYLFNNHFKLFTKIARIIYSKRA